LLRDIKYRFGLIIFAVITSAYLIWPTYKLYSLNKDEVNSLQKEEITKLKQQSINLGLDLQGGMYILLEIGVSNLVEKLASKKTDELINIIDKADSLNRTKNTDFFVEFLNLANNQNLHLVRYYTKLRSERNNESVVSELKLQRDNAISSALEIIRNRIDEFGVSEPTIQKFGSDRIIIELAGVQDSDRARQLIQRTASLEFSLVLNEKLEFVLERLDTFLLNDSTLTGNESTIVLNKSMSENIDEDAEDIFLEEDFINLPANNNLTSSEILKEKPFSGYLKIIPQGIGVILNEVPKVKNLLNSPKIKNLIPRDGEFLWGSSTEIAQNEMGSFIEYVPLFYVSSIPEISGGMVREPTATMGSAGSDASGQWVVNMSMSAEGTKKWSHFTGANINRQVAIVLDDRVYMAPVIRDKIPTGQTQVSGFANVNEAKDIANVLRAGELPAPVKIVEERTIGPSLGKDSIISGTKSMLIGFVLVILFMIIYYRSAGILATLALIFNLTLVIAVLAALKATLTLPGIAGLILTIGMSVDANVIVFERIREELRIGKTVKSAIDSGYERAFITILDANVTTLIAAFVLAWIGSGPIKGFAVTLCTGIICSMFTAIFFTRTIFMIMTNNRKKQNLSI